MDLRPASYQGVSVIVVHYAPFPRGKSSYEAKCGHMFNLYAKEGHVATDLPAETTCKACMAAWDVIESKIEGNT